nr:DMT family transporter [Nannocystis pusilla]
MHGRLARCIRSRRSHTLAAVTDHLGELAALGTAVCWALGSLAFTRAGRRIGSLPLNVIRLALALVFAALAGLVLRGRPWPSDATAEQWWWLGLSGFLGYFLGDLCQFRAFIEIGPRLTLLIMALAPPLTAVIDLVALDQRLSLLSVAGMATTLAGVAWVLSERTPAGATPGPASPRLRGILLGLGGALGQAVGLVLSKRGMIGYEPLQGAQIRMIVGLACFVALVLATGTTSRLRAGLRDRGALGYATVGAMLGPFLGVSLALFALQRTSAGVAASLLSTSPIFIIPLATRLEGERVGLRGLLGALVAVTGVALLFAG